eukprot:1882857-Lingulodinium_polyedra.AAC.1
MGAMRAVGAMGAMRDLAQAWSKARWARSAQAMGAERDLAQAWSKAMGAMRDLVQRCAMGAMGAICAGNGHRRSSGR